MCRAFPLPAPPRISCRLWPLTPRRSSLPRAGRAAARAREAARVQPAGAARRRAGRGRPAGRPGCATSAPPAATSVIPGLAERGGRRRQGIDVSHLNLFPMPNIEDIGRAAAGAGRGLGQRRQRGEPAGAVAAARPGPELPPGLGGRRGAGRGLCGLDVLARRGDHRFLRPPAASGHQRAGVPAVLQRGALRLRGAAPAAVSSSWSPTGRCRAATPPTTGSACSTGAPRWPRR